MKPFLSILFCSLIWFPTLTAQLTLKVTEIPANTPLGDSIFVAGNFTNWEAGNINYQLVKNNSGEFEITINPNPGELKFKFTRGDWGRVEGDNSGNFRPDRVYQYDGNPVTQEFKILSWESQNSGNSTAASNVYILDENFFIPQLNRSRKIWIYLPPDYDSSNKKYPVLYMHDGQNLFDQATSFSGEWEVDETLNALFDQGDYGVIVIGIDNGGANRIDEYLPWAHPTYGGGNGGLYIDFIVETLKPYVDQNYRTYPTKEYTGIMGSSLGGLISCYGTIEHQEVFGKSGCFSSSFWLYDFPYQQVTDTGKKENIKMYMIAGQQESSTTDVVGDMYRMQQTLFAAGFSNTEIKAIDHADGTHSEWYWAREFAAAYQWLFSDIDVSIPSENFAIDYQVSVYPNPGEDFLIIEKEKTAGNFTLQLYDLNGKLLLQNQLLDDFNKVALPDFVAGTFIIQISENNKVVFTEKWVRK